MRGPVEGGDKLKVAALDDSGPISYLLAAIPNNVSYETVSEQPEVEPNQPLTWPLSFHGGIGYSRYDPEEAGFAANDGFGLHKAGYILAPLNAAQTVLTGAANPVQYFFEAAVNDGGADDGQPVLYAIAPEAAEINIYKISLDSGDFGTLLNTKTQSVTPTQPMGRPAEWNDGTNTYWRLGLGDTTNDFTSLTSIVSGTAADTWSSATDADARHLQLYGNRLARSTGANEISILPRASDPETEANWGGEFFVGDVSANITELGEAGGFVYIGKEDGFYEWDAVGEAVNVFPAIGRATRNCQGMVYWHGGFLIPAESGLWWTRTGKPVGPDSNPANLSNDRSQGANFYFKHGRWQGLAAYGEYIYGLYVASGGTNAYLTMGRERDESDPPGWGPIIWQTLNFPAGDFGDFHGVFITKTSEFSATETRPRLWFPEGNNLRSIWLDKDGAPTGRRGDIDVSASTITLHSGLIDFGYPRVNKQLQVVQGWAEDMQSDHQFQFGAAADGETFANFGSAITARGFFQSFWTQDSLDTGRSFHIRVLWTASTNLTDQNGDKLRDIVVQAVALPDTTREWTFLFAVEDEQSKTAKKIRSELEGYVGDMKKYTLPDRDTFNGVMGKPRLLRADEIAQLTPRNQDPPHYVIAASVREISGS